jgi:hypothetical protein
MTALNNPQITRLEIRSAAPFEVKVKLTAEWYHSFLDGDGEGIWQAIPFFSGNQCTGTYEVGNDQFVGCCYAANAGNGLSVGVDFAPQLVHFLRIKYTANMTVTRSTTTDKIQIISRGDTDVTLKSIDTTGGQQVCDTGEISVDVGLLELRCWAGQWQCDTGAFARITKIEVWGKGYDPFV